MRNVLALTALGVVAGSLMVPGVRTAAAAVLPGASPAEAFGESTVRILLLGADFDYTNTGRRLEKPGRSDTLVLANLDIANGKASLCSIPRDTEAEIPGHGVRKINAAYALGGTSLARETVGNLIGSPVDYVVAIDVDAFREAVDAVGGVDVEVEKHLKYDDNWAGLHIDIPAGLQHLDGSRAMQYVRFRHDAMADIGRTRRQQVFLKAFGRALRKPTAIVAWPGVVKAVASHTETNLSAAQMIALGRFARSLGPEDISSETLPGEFSGARWHPDRQALRRLASNPAGGSQ
jgi:LCP family protein required for cell wall assembly